jgi:hypothetical protein
LVALGLAATGIGLLALKAKLGETNSFEADWASDVVGVLAGVALASAGLSEVVRAWQRRVWERQTAFIVLGLMQRIVSELARTARAAFAVLEHAPPSYADIHGANYPVGDDLYSAYSIPEDEFGERRFERLRDAMFAVTSALEAEEVSEDTGKAVLDAAAGAASEMARRAARVEDLVANLSVYRAKEAARLQQATIELARRANEFEENFGSGQRDRTPTGRHPAWWATIAAGGLLVQTHELVPPLSAGFSDVYTLVDPDGKGTIAPAR